MLDMLSSRQANFQVWCDTFPALPCLAAGDADPELGKSAVPPGGEGPAQLPLVHAGQNLPYFKAWSLMHTSNSEWG